MRVVVLLWCLLIGIAALAEEEMLDVVRKVVTPDGKPVVGARVVVRSFDTVRMQQEVATTTGTDGTVRARIRYRAYHGMMSPFGPPSHGYMMVDLPGYALAFGRLPVNGYDDGPLQLTPIFQQRGLIVDTTTNKPVAGATVFVLGLTATVPVNFRSADVTTKELVTTTAADGSFTFRGVTSEVLGGFGMPTVVGVTNGSVVAYYTVNGKTSVGENRNFTFSATTQTPQRVDITPAALLQGTVVDSLSGKPVAGASVNLEGTSDWINYLPDFKTDANGVYRVPVIPTNITKLYVTASQDDHTSACVLVYEKQAQRGQPAPMPAVISPEPISIHPLGPPVTVQIIDASTGKPVLPVASVELVVDKGIFDDDLKWVGNASISATADERGMATVRLPIGDNDVKIRCFGYEPDATITIPAQGVVVLKTQRREGVFLHFSGGKILPIDSPTIYSGDGKRMSSDGSCIDAKGYWFYALKGAPAGPYQIHMPRGGGDKVPLTTVDPAVWPNEITVK